MVLWEGSCLQLLELGKTFVEVPGGDSLNTIVIKTGKPLSNTQRYRRWGVLHATMLEKKTPELMEDMTPQ